jgi:CelD/BcsL family acetyltransferase involved in cellulose biosynthesis
MGLPQLRQPWITTQALYGDRGQLEHLLPEWERLWERARNPEPFYRPEWSLAYLRAFQPRANALLLEARSERRLCAVLPLVEQVRAMAGFHFRILRGTANDFTGRFDMLCERGPEGDLSAEAIWHALRQLDAWDAIELPNVPADGMAPRLLELAAADGFLTGRWPGDQSPFARLQPGAPCVKFGRTSHFRSNLRRRLRKATVQGELRLTRLEHFSESALQTFLALEKSGWKGRAGTAIASSQDSLRFYQEITPEVARHGYLSMYFLELAGRPIAAHFGITSQGRYYIPKVAYDESRSELSPGHLLIDQVMADLPSRGIHLFDFVGPRMPWKEEWTNEHRQHWSLYIYRRIARGRLLHFARFVLRKAARDVLRHRRTAGPSPASSR